MGGGTVREITLPYPYLVALAILKGHPSYVTVEEIIEAEGEEAS